MTSKKQVKTKRNNCNHPRSHSLAICSEHGQSHQLKLVTFLRFWICLFVLASDLSWLNKISSRHSHTLTHKEQASRIRENLRCPERLPNRCLSSTRSCWLSEEPKARRRLRWMNYSAKSLAWTTSKKWKDKTQQLQINLGDILLQYVANIADATSESAWHFFFA